METNLKTCQGQATEKIKLTVSTVPLRHSQEERDPEDGDGAVQVGRTQNPELPGPLLETLRRLHLWLPLGKLHLAAFHWLSAASVTQSRETQFQLREQVHHRISLLCGI